MNDKPVAWLLFRDGGESYPEYTNSYKQMREWETYLGDNERIEPHYTHPAKELDEQFKEGFEAGKVEGWKAHKFHHSAKTLTDEEIEQEWVKSCPDKFHTNLIGFARAILRKAQEK